MGVGNRHRPSWRILLISFALLSAGCAGPGKRSLDVARQLELEYTEAGATALPMLLFRNRAPETNEPLHVYIDGDGTPWLGSQPARDPGPREPLALRLMARDPDAAILLGRPCYHGTYNHPDCKATWWTDRRYSPRIVDTMAQALSGAVPSDRAVTLIGYSGGGVLAMLLAERLANVTAVVTVAANLDVDAWAELRGYEPLSGSLNPARRAALPASIRQIHLAGGSDTNVPQALTKAFASERPNAEIEILEGFDHACCWRDAWQEILARIRRKQASFHQESTSAAHTARQ